MFWLLILLLIFETIAVYHLQTDMCKIIYRPLYADKVMVYVDGDSIKRYPRKQYRNIFMDMIK